MIDLELELRIRNDWVGPGGLSEGKGRKVEVIANTTAMLLLLT